LLLEDFKQQQNDM